MTQVILIDLHQLNVKQLQTIQISALNTGQPHVNETEPAEQQPATLSAFLTK